MKKKYLVVYDYGMGGLWAVITARSNEEIAQKYPQLIVKDSWPKWMSEEEYKEVEAKDSYDIDDPPSGLLADLALDK
jgi:hypothetical protein